MKGVAIQMIIQQNKDWEFKQKLKIYHDLIKHHNEYAKYGYSPDANAASIHLSACITLYHNIDPSKIISIFEEYQSLNTEHNFDYKVR